MHVLLMTSYFPSSADPARASFCLEHALALARSGHQVGLVVLPWNEPGSARRRLGATLVGALRRHVDEQPHAGIPTVRCTATWPARWPRTGMLVARWHGRRAFRRYVRRRGMPDVVHVHYAFYAGEVATAVKRAHRIPVVLTEHHSAFLRRNVERGRVEALTRTFREADHLLAVSAALASALQPFAPGRDIEVLGNAVDPSFFTLPPSPPPPAPFAVALVARLLSNKSVDLLIDAFDRAFRGTDAVLRIGGDGEERARLEALVRQRGLDARVEFLGTLSRDAVRALLHRSHVLVSCSRLETFGITLIEAMACGRPVVATRSGGPDGMIAAGDGLLVAPGDPEALAGALQTVRREYARFDPVDIRARCAARFGERAMVGRLDDIYEGLAPDASHAAVDGRVAATGGGGDRPGT